MTASNQLMGLAIICEPRIAAIAPDGPSEHLSKRPRDSQAMRLEQIVFWLRNFHRDCFGFLAHGHTYTPKWKRVSRRI